MYIERLVHKTIHAIFLHATTSKSYRCCCLTYWSKNHCNRAHPFVLSPPALWITKRNQRNDDSYRSAGRQASTAAGKNTKARRALAPAPEMHRSWERSKTTCGPQAHTRHRRLAQPALCWRARPSRPAFPSRPCRSKRRFFQAPAGTRDRRDRKSVV